MYGLLTSNSDRNNLAQARLGGLEIDLGMNPESTQFNLVTSILFVGYLLMQLPSNLLLTRVRPSLYMGIVMAVWGTISAAQSAVQSYGSLIACRFILGFAEAPFFAAAIMLMSSWYTRKELSVRIAWFYSGSSLANMFGGLIAAGVLSNLDGAHGIQGWRWLFIIEGVITVGIAFCSIFVLPDFPASTKWLTPEQRNYAQWRLVIDADEADDTQNQTIKQGLKAAFMDYRLYICILFQHTSLLSQTFQYFFPSIVQTLGYNNIVTLLLTVPVWGFTFLWSLLMTWSSGRSGDRSLHIIALMLLSCIGNIIAVSTTSTGARFFAMFLMPAGAVAAYQIILSWIANTFIRPMVKRSAAIATCNMIGNTASIYGSYMWPKRDAPRYIAGGGANAGICLVVAGLAVVLRLVLQRENRKLEVAEREGRVADGMESLDTRAAGFRYVI